MNHESYKFLLARRAMPVVAVLFIFSACSGGNDLSRSAAKELILANSEYPKERVEKLLVGQTGMSSSKSREQYAATLEQAGLATVTFESKEVEEKVAFSRLKSTKVSMQVTLTNEAKNYVRGEARTRMNDTNIPVVTSIESFGEITGIAFRNEEKTRALVEYTTNVEPTPFDPIFRRNSAPRTIDRQAVFELYDDGWRVRL